MASNREANRATRVLVEHALDLLKGRRAEEARAVRERRHPKYDPVALAAEGRALDQLLALAKGEQPAAPPLPPAALVVDGDTLEELEQRLTQANH